MERSAAHLPAQDLVTSSVAEAWGLARTTVHAARADGRVRWVKLDARCVLYAREDVLALIAALDLVRPGRARPQLRGVPRTRSWSRKKKTSPSATSLGSIATTVGAIE